MLLIKEVSGTLQTADKSIYLFIGKILVFTGAAEKLFGYGRKEVIGKNVKVLMNDRDGEAHDAYIKSYLRSGGT